MVVSVYCVCCWLLLLVGLVFAVFVLRFVVWLSMIGVWCCVFVAVYGVGCLVVLVVAVVYLLSGELVFCYLEFGFMVSDLVLYSLIVFGGSVAWLFVLRLCWWVVLIVLSF